MSNLSQLNTFALSAVQSLHILGGHGPRRGGSPTGTPPSLTDMLTNLQTRQTEITGLITELKAVSNPSTALTSLITRLEKQSSELAKRITNIQTKLGTTAG